MSTWSWRSPMGDICRMRSPAADPTATPATHTPVHVRALLARSAPRNVTFSRMCDQSRRAASPVRREHVSIALRRWFVLLRRGRGVDQGERERPSNLCRTTLSTSSAADRTVDSTPRRMRQLAKANLCQAGCDCSGCFGIMIIPALVSSSPRTNSGGRSREGRTTPIRTGKGEPCCPGPGRFPHQMRPPISLHQTSAKS
jgi:hypothetical protein